MKYFNLYIKSHAEAPDTDIEYQAKDIKEAVEVAYNWLHGEYTKEDIQKNYLREVIENE